MANSKETGKGARAQGTNVSPHYRMVEEDAIKHYKLGLITLTGLIYYLADGCQLRIDNVDAFCKKVGISKSGFYKSIAKLETLKIIELGTTSSELLLESKTILEVNS